VEEQQWQPCTWQQLDMEVAAAVRRSRPTAAWQVQLRAPVRHLQQLWQLRLQVRGRGAVEGHVVRPHLLTFWLQMAQESGYGPVLSDAHSYALSQTIMG